MLPVTIYQEELTNHPYTRASAIADLLVKASLVIDADLTTELRFLWQAMRLDDLTNEEREQILERPCSQFVSQCGHGNLRVVLALKDLVPTSTLIEGFKFALTRDQESVIDALLASMSNPTLYAVVASYHLEEVFSKRDEQYVCFNNGRFMSIAEKKREKERQCYERVCKIVTDREAAEINAALGDNLIPITAKRKKRI